MLLTTFQDTIPAAACHLNSQTPCAWLCDVQAQVWMRDLVRIQGQAQGTPACTAAAGRQAGKCIAAAASQEPKHCTNALVAICTASRKAMSVGGQVALRRENGPAGMVCVLSSLAALCTGVGARSVGQRTADVKLNRD